MSPVQVHVGVFGEIDTNLVDGSSMWLQSVALTLASLANVRVTVLLRTPLKRDVVVGPMKTHPQITVVDPATRKPEVRRLSAEEAVELLVELDQEQRFDRLLLRGHAVADAATAVGAFDGRIWLYHVPARGSDPRQEADDLRRRTGACDRVLCQTESIARLVESAAPDTSDRLLILPPMVPSVVAEPRIPSGPLRRLVYAGKFAPEYYFLETVALFERVRAQLPGVVWDVAGDKIHNPPEDPGFKPAAEEALRATAGLVWHGAVGRERVHELLIRADVALSIRHPDMDVSPELSTKVLEYGAAGCPALVNRNSVHTALLGEDYPLLAADPEEARLRLLAADHDPDLRAEAQRRCYQAAEGHTFARVAQMLAAHLPVSTDPPSGGALRRDDDGSLRLLIAGHQFGFMDDILSYAVEHGAVIREDRWSRHVIHDEQATAEAVEWANVIHCEWCLGNAIWCSRHRRDDQRLVVRFHRMELETAYPDEVDLDRVDAMVFVGQHILEAACERFGWPRDHPALRVVPNSIDVDRLARDKLPMAQYTLGLIGWVPMRKRIDRAIELLEQLRAHDDRFHLLIKGNAPWDYYWMAVRDDERRQYEAVLRRIERSPLLRSAVTFEPFGDMADFMQKIGWVLSVSDGEGHAVAPAEGMAAGSIPVVFERPGAYDQYPTEWVHSGPDPAAQFIRGVLERREWSSQSRRARELAQEWRWDRLAPVWHELLSLGQAA